MDFMILGAAWLVYGMVIPMLVLQFIAVLLVPSLIADSSDIRASGKAIYCYLAQSIGGILMSIGGILTLHFVLSSIYVAGVASTALLLLFGAGGLIFLLHDSIAQSIDEKTRMVPFVITMYTWKFIGLMSILASALSFVLKILVSTQALENSWWILHLILIGYGILLLVITKDPPKHQSILSRLFTKKSTKKKK